MSRHNRSSSSDGLVRDHNDNPLPHLANCIRVLEAAMAESKTEGCLQFNDLTHVPELVGRPPWRDQASYDAAIQVPDPDHPGQMIESTLGLDDHEMMLAQVMIQRHPSTPLAVGYDTAIRAVEVIARRRTFHPVRDWLRALAWDGTDRMDEWMAQYLDAPSTDYVRKVGAITLIGAVARVMNPGCRFDTVTVLEGSQGVYKSTACEVLGGPWYLDGLGSEARLDKEAVIAMAGSWVIELSEIDYHLRANNASALKAFLSRATDTFRPIYGRKAIQVPRQSVFIGTTNKDFYLNDPTGNRRFLPVPIFTKGGTARVEPLRYVVDQLWAQAVASYDQGVPYWMEGSGEMDMLNAEVEERFIPDLLEGEVEDYCRADGGWREPVSPSEIASLIVSTRPVMATMAGLPERIANIIKRLGYLKIRQESRPDGRKRMYYRG